MIAVVIEMRNINGTDISAVDLNLAVASSHDSTKFLKRDQRKMVLSA